MKKTHLVTISVSALFIVLYLHSSQSALAHFPQTDNNMTALLHIDPEDNPIPGQAAYFNFIFNDSSNRFKVTDCNCIVSVKEAGKTVFKTRLKPQGGQFPSVYGSSFSYRFPRRDVYIINLDGQPKNPNNFERFNLTWNFRVDQNPLPVKKFALDIYLAYFIAIFGLLILTGIVVYILLQ